MPFIDYTGKGRKGLGKSTLWLIEQANIILDRFTKQNYVLTLRQLFYQMVSRDMIPNTTKSYNNLGTAISTGRERGLVDWDQLTDRLRELEKWQTYDNVPDAMTKLAERFRLDKWRNQPCRPEVWVEKDALSDVVRRACWKLQVPYLVCRGYGSSSALWQAGRRMIEHRKSGQQPYVIHLGDHDPSGLHMTEDNRNRISLFGLPAMKGDKRASPRLKRIALNMDQIEKYNPPPNPAKMTDSRWQGYVDATGLEESWELDALEPAVIEQLIEDAVLEIRDEDAWEKMVELEKEGRKLLSTCSDGWGDVKEFLKDTFGE